VPFLLFGEPKRPVVYERRWLRVARAPMPDGVEGHARRGGRKDDEAIALDVAAPEAFDEEAPVMLILHGPPAAWERRCLGARRSVAFLSRFDDDASARVEEQLPSRAIPNKLNPWYLAGLNGGSAEPYVQDLVLEANRRGWVAVVPKLCAKAMPRRASREVLLLDERRTTAD